MSSEPTVFVVDDDPDLRRSLRELLDSAGLPCETFGTRQDFLIDYDGARPGCLILDIRLGTDNGLDIQDDLQRRRIGLPVIVLTGHGDVPNCRRALQSGAVDFLEKPAAPNRLLESIQRAIVQDEEARDLATRRDELERRLARLTPREREVLDRLLAARTSKEIGTELGISDRTVEKHRREILRKMEVDSTAGVFRALFETTGSEPLQGSHRSA